MEYYAIYLPYQDPDLSVIKTFYTEKEEALKVLKQYKDARLKAFRTSEEAVFFYLNGPSDPIPTTAPKSPNGTAAKLKLEKTPFKAPKSQELVAFRKNIEKNELDAVRNTIQLNPRYLVSSGDMPTILKEGTRYNALHVVAIEGKTEMCKLILQTIENPSFIEFLHGQRNPSTDEVSAILLDLYLNMPDKSRSETPLHFAAKFGSVGVVEVLISYPQCKMTKNSEGKLPKDIICSRAKGANASQDVHKAIEDLLQGRFFVPVLRAVDNSTPPVVGEPFTLSNPPNLEARDKFSPKLEIKAYAGPMDKDKAQVFCKRWKTPPRLIPSPKYISPVKPTSSSKIPVCIAGSESTSPLSSTPIGKKFARTLFPNRSFEQALAAQEEQDINNSLNNNFEIDVLKEDVDEEERQQDESNGNRVPETKPIAPIRSAFGSRISPIKKNEDTNLLYRKYREHLQDLFTTIYDDDDDSEVDDLSLGVMSNPEPVPDKPRGNAEGSFSYFCDGNNSFYEGTNIADSPSFKERKLRLTDTEKGLEIIGRNLAKDHDVGWTEYWNFLGTFADLRSDEGLQLFEEYLQKSTSNSDPASISSSPVKNSRVPVPLPFKARLLDKSNDSLGSVCDALEKLSLGYAAKVSQPVDVHNFKKPLPAGLLPLETENVCSNITNPYLCLHNSLWVFAKRFVKNLDESSTTVTMDFATFFQQAVVDCVRKLNSMVDKYKKDAAFASIDFSKSHSRYAQLIVICIELHKETAKGVIHRLKLLLDKSREVNSARKYPELHDSLICLQNFLDFYILKKDELMKDCQVETETESSCSRTWRENPLVHCCHCRIDGTYAKKGSLERLSIRREQRKKSAISQLAQQQQQQEMSVLTSSSVSSLGLTNSMSSPGSPSLDRYRTSVMIPADTSEDDDEEYFSCSDSDLDTDTEDEDSMNVNYETPPSSPSFFSDSGLNLNQLDGFDDRDDEEDQFCDVKDTDDDSVEEEDSSNGSSGTAKPYKHFIEGQEPTKQDLDVLNVVEKRPIEQAKFPLVYEWRKAMLKMSEQERERLSSKAHRTVRRTNLMIALPESGNSMAPAAPLSSSPPITPLSAEPRLFRPDLSRNSTLNDSGSSIDGRLGLMSISGFASSHQRMNPALS